MYRCILFICLFISPSPEMGQARFHAKSRLISPRGTLRLPGGTDVGFKETTRKLDRQPSAKTCQENSSTARPWSRLTVTERQRTACGSRITVLDKYLTLLKGASPFRNN